MWLPKSLQSSGLALLAGSLLLGNVAAQVHTDCFPMEKECPPDPGLGIDIGFNFNVTPKFELWETTVGKVTYDNENGASFAINKHKDSPTIRSRFYFFWGRTEIWMRAAHGTGVISSIMFLSDNLDEIDWEFFGGNDTVAQSNYFGKNSSSFVNAGYHPVPGGVQNDFHNYTTVWTKDYLDFYVDGNKVRTLLPQDADNGRLYPQTPMRLWIGIWAGGDPDLPPGTREWAGGDTDYSKGPYTMHVKSVSVNDFSSGKEYIYTDKTGSWESIKVVEGESTAAEVYNKVPEKTLGEKWNDLPNTAKIAVYASGAGVGGILLMVGLFYCIRQRRRGAAEAKAAVARAEQDRLELEGFKRAGVNPDGFTSQATEYNAKEMAGISDKDGYTVPTSPKAVASPTNEKFGAAGYAAVGAAGAAAGAAAMRGPGSPRGQGSPRGPGSPGGPGSPRANDPLLRSGSTSPRFPPASFGEPLRSPTGSMYGQSMSPPPHQPLPHPPNRSMTNPGKVGSPGPSQGFDFGLPQRAATTSPAPPSGYGNPPGPQYGNGEDQEYWNRMNGGNR
ncbi:putative glycosidase crf1 [Cladorrhinum sp. PSN332]|nr:putative glycosidase crf1 [Cladorrhinum sp. PSN332]